MSFVFANLSANNFLSIIIITFVVGNTLFNK